MVLGSFEDGFAGDGPIENMLMGDRQTALYDNGFYNIGVVPTGNDLGVGGTDPWDNPLSFTRQSKSAWPAVRRPTRSRSSLNPVRLPGGERLRADLRPGASARRWTARSRCRRCATSS